MRVLGLLCCLAGVIIAYPAIMEWTHFLFSAMRTGHLDPQTFAAAAEPIFEKAASGQILIGVGFLMMLASFLGRPRRGRY